MRMRIILLVGGVVLFGTGCIRQSQPMPQAQKVSFQTSDGVIIVGDYVDAGAGALQALLLHMMPATRASYAQFTLKLREAGIASLAIDFRGHGESVKKFTDNSSQFTVLDYRKFSDAEQQAKILDVRAAIEWLTRNKQVTKSRLVVVGASIGANLALQYLAENPEVLAAVLLSPGLDYRGVITQPLAQLVKPTQALYFAASADDEYSLTTNRTLYALTRAKKQLKEFQTAGHGTTMFEREPALMSELIGWIREQVK